MTCREFAEFLDAFVAGSLPAEQAAAFQRHLAVCAHCVAYLDSYCKTVEAVRALRDQPELPSDIPDELIDAILKARDPGP